MPELPEVETTIKDLKRKILNRQIKDVWFDAPLLIKKPKPQEFVSKIKGLKIKGIRRRGKNILLDLTGEKTLLIHQKLTGHLLYGKWEVQKIGKGKFIVKPLIKGPLEEEVNNYIHLIFYLDNGWQLALSDLRKFAKVVFGRKEVIENLEELKKLGPEPLAPDFTFENYKEIIKKQSRKIKQVLMDQEIISGIGNIYSDEILWEAKVHPFKPAKKVKEEELRAIYQAMKKILKEAIEKRGTSTSDFRDPSGEKGFYTEIRRVYQREGEKCSRCKNLIKRVKIGGRSAHFCPYCQRL